MPESQIEFTPVLTEYSTTIKSLPFNLKIGNKLHVDGGPIKITGITKEQLDLLIDFLNAVKNKWDKL
jgi:hypothetical protein